jgi:hypothetical protein
MAVKSRPLPRRKRKPEAAPTLEWKIERLFSVCHHFKARLIAIEQALNTLVSKGQTTS